MNLDWRRLKAVVIESDDWGLCAWSADTQAFRVLADTPVYRTPSGRRYGGSTLESADDLRAMVSLLEGAAAPGGLPPVLQANMIMATPDYARLRPPMFEAERLPLIDFPGSPSRWKRPGIEKALAAAVASAVWWPELHGLHHLPEHAWIQALRRGEADARRAHEHQSLLCTAVEHGGEYGADEPLELRRAHLEGAVSRFRTLFRRAPGSFCPPDYHWDERLDALANELGLLIFQGVAESAGAKAARFRRLFHRFRFPHYEGRRFVMPPRIAFEPIGPDGPSEALGAARSRRAIHDAWGRGQPAVVSTHRMNYVHLQPGWAEAGREALAKLLAHLAEDAAIFLVDTEVRALIEQGWSVRPVGTTGAVFHYYAVPNEAVRWPAPDGITAVRVTAGPEGARLTLEGREVVAHANVGSYLLEWGRA